MHKYFSFIIISKKKYKKREAYFSFIYKQIHINKNFIELKYKQLLFFWSNKGGIVSLGILTFNFMS